MADLTHGGMVADMPANDDDLLDPANYESPRRTPKSDKRQRAAVISVRLTPAELEIVQSRAHAAGQPVSTYLRGLALATAPTISWQAVASLPSPAPAESDSATTPPVSDWQLCSA